MTKSFIILAILAVVVALPFVFRVPPPQGDWRPGDPTIVIVSPHNEAIRYEFARAFSVWHKEKYGRPVKIDWRNIGGTTEISRYLGSEYAASAKAWWSSREGGRGAADNTNRAWPASASADDLIKTATPTEDTLLEIYNAYRQTDRPDAITSGIDIFFGGGEYDHRNAFRSGFTVACDNELPKELFVLADGTPRIPQTQSGETWRTPSLFGNALSTFGIIYNIDRLNDLGIEEPPTRWNDLTDRRYYRQVGLADPTKSGSIAKAFEMIVHQQMHSAVWHHYYSNRPTKDSDIDPDAIIAANEKRINDYIKTKGKAYKLGDVPDDLKEYQATLEGGFINGLNMIQKIGANARYFTDSASKVPIDVSTGDAAVGMAIDFYGRYQAESARDANGRERMKFVTPVGGTSVSCDPVSLLRGAGGHALREKQSETREVALHFIEFVLSDEGQRLWCYKVGEKDTDGNLIGPEKYALRRVPIARNFYPGTQPSANDQSAKHQTHSVDDLADPDFNPYEVSKSFTYYPRWTGGHFSILREIVRSMCLDSGEELREAQGAMIRRNDPKFPQPFGPMPTVTLHVPELYKGQPTGRLEEVEVPLNWRTATQMKRYDELEYKREWTAYFRNIYRKIAAGESVSLAPIHFDPT